MAEQLNIFLVFLAGLTSVASPCVFPIVPIVVTGGGQDHRFRPIMIVAGLSLTFTTMGILSSLFGSVIGSKMPYVEKVAGALITLFGLLLVANVNLFKQLHFFSRFAEKSRGKWGGFFLGFTLGIIWIPCVGPMLSGVLAMVAVKGAILTGAGLLLVYSLGFAVPMLLAGYASQFFRQKIRKIGTFPYVINAVSGVILIALGLFIVFKGMVGFGF
jgi:cytochrome c-type biogenesis protein